MVKEPLALQKSTISRSTMPINSDASSRPLVYKVNNINIYKRLINNDENRTSLDQQTNETSVSTLLAIAPRSDSVPHPQLLKYNSIGRSQPNCKHVTTACLSSSSINENAVLNNEQFKYLPTDSTSPSIKDNTGSLFKTQMACSEHNLNSQAVASLQFSIKIPIKHLHKLHIDPERISCETTEWPEHSSEQILGHPNTTSTESTCTLKDDNASLKSNQFVKYSFRSTPIDGNILHLKSSVQVKDTRLRSSNEMKNVALQSDNLVRQSCNSDSCQDMPLDLSMHARSGLNSSNAHYQRVESKDTCTVNTTIQTKSDSQELRYDNECCSFPVDLKSSTSININLNCKPMQQQSQTENHVFKNSREKSSSNNIIMDHTSSQLNQKEKRVKKETRVTSKYIHTSKTGTTCSLEHATLSSSETKKPISVYSVHNAPTLIANNTRNSLCDCVYFNDDSTSSDSGLTCGLTFTTNWSETSNSDEMHQDYNLSIDKPLKYSNPCQLSVACSQEDCTCLLWTDSIEKHTHDWEAREPSNLFHQRKGYINSSQNQSKLSKTQNHYDSNGEHGSKECKSNKAALSKPNFALQQMLKECNTETNDQAFQKSKEVHKNKQKRPFYKLSLDSNLSDKCNFAQRVERAEPEPERSGDVSQVAQNPSRVCTSTDQASPSYLKCNIVRKNESVKKVHFPDGINSQIISPLYETSLAKNDDHNFCINSYMPIDQNMHVLQSKTKNKKLHSKHSALEQQLKSKLRYGTVPKTINENSSIFDDRFDFHNITGEILLLPTENEGLPNRSNEFLSTTSCTDYILTDSTPVTSITPTSSKSCMNPYEMYTPFNTPYALSLEQISETNVHNTKSNLINTTFINPCIDKWKNNSISSLCNISALDVSDEMDQHARQGIHDRIFLSEIPINTTIKVSSSTACKSDSGENIKHIIHSNNESLSYPEFSNTNTRKAKTNADANLNGVFPRAHSLLSEGSDNLHRVKNNCPYNRMSNLKEPIDVLCKKTSVSQQQDTCVGETLPKPVQKASNKSIAVETHNNPGNMTSTSRYDNSSEKCSDECCKILSKNRAYGVKSFKRVDVTYKQQCNNNCTETVHEHPDAPNNIPSSQGCVLSSEHIYQIPVKDTSMLEIYKNPKLNKQLKVYKPNWDELANTVNKLQMICNDHTELIEESTSSACSTNKSSEMHSILAAQACVEILQKQLGIRGPHDNQQ